MDNYSSVFAILGGFIFVFAILGIVMYIFTALGLQTMATKLNIENPWLAWIPIANIYIIGRIAGDQVTIFNKDIPKLGLVLLIGALVCGFVSWIPVIGFLICIAFAVIYCVALYKIYRIFIEESAVLYCILSIVINVTAPFLIYSASKNSPNLAIFNEKSASQSGAGPTTPYTTAPPVFSEPVVEAASEQVAETVVEAEDKTQE